MRIILYIDIFIYKLLDTVTFKISNKTNICIKISQFVDEYKENC